MQCLPQPPSQDILHLHPPGAVLQQQLVENVQLVVVLVPLGAFLALLALAARAAGAAEVVSLLLAVRPVVLRVVPVSVLVVVVQAALGARVVVRVQVALEGRDTAARLPLRKQRR